MKTIELTKGYKAIIDDEDFGWLNQWKWSYDNGYACRGIWINKKVKKIYMHRIIIDLQNENTGEQKKGFGDHINGTKLDNRRENLRIATNQQNCFNGKLPKNNKSGYKGVSWDNKHNKWLSQIMINRKTKHLGYYSNPKIAALAYNIAARGYYGKFARVNNL